ncbi:YrzA family protein [Bacillus sp. CGMCC 1.16541]|uniref:YrzA family protein n=1 Tax=Bacillus sp. CGMCC 1.16541 TaxID=2185143 RepID=UPI000D731660|nr:YrzA family protein [Bacillus sp. CGMCC 1.16541]
MNFQIDFIKDKVEFFESTDLRDLEKQITEKIEQNKAILLEVESVSHQMSVDYNHGKRYYSAVVHFKSAK